jgi:mono/diheme cytochrome c family protein
MAEFSLLGLFHDPEQVSVVVDQLRKMGVGDDRVTILSGIPYKAAVFGRPRPPRRVLPIALTGSVLGILTGVFLTAGIFLLYPLRQGGQPIVPIPPSLIVLFEATMLGTMWASFFGLLVANRFPVFLRRAYDPRITEGHIGLEARVDEASLEVVEGIYRAQGAHHLQRFPIEAGADRKMVGFWVGAGAFVLLIAAVTLLVGYDVVKIHFPTNMAEQDSIAYEQGPRLAAPAEAVPVQGPALIAGRPASEPVPATADSLQRGQVLYGINCLMCHGTEGKGNGTLSGFFTPRPADLTGDTVRGLSDTQIFLVITQGFGPMPSLAENLSAVERWDLVNYVRSLQK